MSMRITNKIMQNNSLTNINNNKVQQDKLSTQMETGKKITRPSDDPVIAIRALRLRSTYAEVVQYCDKNIEDADSWLSVTEDSLTSVVDAIEDMIEQCNSGSNKDLETANRRTILDNLKALRDSVYSTGDADYAGRGLFTGYRTSTKLRFQEDTTQQYTITESVTKAALDDITYVNTKGIENINEGNYTVETIPEEGTIYQETVHRLRLSYDKLDETYTAGNEPEITYYDATGTLKTVKADVVSKYDTTKDAYLYAQDSASTGVVFIPETGELILSDSMYQTLSSTRDNPVSQTVNEGAISITYSKTDWRQNDLRPEHYFYCESKGIIFNEGGNVDGLNGDQIIEYDVGFNQSIRINTLASEAYTHDIGRDVDDLINILEQVEQMEDVVNQMQKKVDADDTDEEAKTALDSAKKAYTYLNQKMQDMFENGITRMKDHLTTVTKAITEVGTRSAKVDLVRTRLKSQKTNFKDLVADNEEADTTEVAIELSSAKLAYDASLMATGKIAQTTLLNYI
ncbi:MAG: flagellar hook-associated protein FlgL [Lachnospiraceae bacterium]